MKNVLIHVTVNGQRYVREVASNQTLLRFLREELFLNSVKEGCDEGECGACTVLVDGHPVNSCLVLAAELDGKSVLTTEGLAQDARLHPIQEAFIEAGAVQCGYCTPGIIMAAKGLLLKNPHPTRDEIGEALAGNFCRCISQYHVFDAVESVAQEGVAQND